MDNLRLMLLLLAELPLPDVSFSLLSFPTDELVHLSCMALSICVHGALVLVYGCETVCGWRRGWWLRGRVRGFRA